ncbi:MAG: FecR domain-containing protein [Gammaproteobacteria bacterium]
MKNTRRLALLLALSFASAGAQAAEWIYTVQPGDNPWTLTERLLAGIKYWPRIQAHNHIADPEHIPPGTRLRIPVDWLRRAEVTATVAAVQGDAELLRTGVGAARALRTGTALKTGDVVRTGEAGNVTVEFKDGSRMLVHAGSELRMADLAAYENTDLVDTRVELVRGRTESLVQPLRDNPSRFEITTPSAVTSVRGTDFRVNASAQATRTEVLGGKVGVAGASAREVGVEAGYGNVTEESAAPAAPVPLLPPPSLEGLPAVVERVPIAFNVPTQPKPRPIACKSPDRPASSRRCSTAARARPCCGPSICPTATTGCACAASMRRSSRAATPIVTSR